ncbi:MAG: hypothetical protein R3359_03065 [Marinirhabdus sp.]|nr:hypothetical protein [Marinirhabdus sp.]
MKIFCTALSVLFVSLALSQNAVDTPVTDDYLTSKSITVLDNQIEIAGSPYAEEEFQQGNIYKNGKLVASNVAVRYNVSRDEIEVKSAVNLSNTQARVMKANPEIHVRVLNDTYVYMKPKAEDQPSGYFNVMYEGEHFHLYKKLKKRFIEGKKAVNSVARDILPTYQEDYDLYLVDANTNELIELNGSRNRKLKAFPSHNKELKKYTKTEDLNINKDYSLQKLVAYYNTLK